MMRTTVLICKPCHDITLLQRNLWTKNDKIACEIEGVNKPLKNDCFAVNVEMCAHNMIMMFSSWLPTVLGCFFPSAYVLLLNCVKA